MALNIDKPYDLYGALPAAWLVTLRVDKHGIATAKVKEKREAPVDLVELAGWANLAAAPRPGGLGLPCTGISMEWQREDGMWKLEWDFDGATDPQNITFGDPSTSTYEIDCAVTTAPIETHPRFLTIAKQYGVTEKNYDKQGGFLGFPRYLLKGGTSSDTDTTGTKNPVFGLEDYYISTLTYRISSAAVQLPADFQTNLGLINTPRQGGPGAPQLQGRANWLKTTARATWRGNIWATQEEWTASGEQGWDPFIYRSRG